MANEKYLDPNIKTSEQAFSSPNISNRPAHASNAGSEGSSLSTSDGSSEFKEPRDSVESKTSSNDLLLSQELKRKFSLKPNLTNAVTKIAKDPDLQKKLFHNDKKSKAIGLRKRELKDVEMTELETLLNYHNIASLQYFLFQLSVQNFDPFSEAHKNAVSRSEELLFVYKQEEKFKLFSLLKECGDLLSQDPKNDDRSSFKAFLEDSQSQRKSEEKSDENSFNREWFNSFAEKVKSLLGDEEQNKAIHQILAKMEAVITRLEATQAPKDPIVHLSSEALLQKLKTNHNKPSMMRTANSLEMICPNNLTADVETYVIVGEDGTIAVNEEGAVAEYAKQANLDYKGIPGQGKIVYLFYGKTGETAYTSETRTSLLGSGTFDPKTNKLDIAFRGSRSGEVRVPQSLKGEGNADWATDLAFEGVIEPEICQQGRVSYGFAQTYLSVKPALARICAEAIIQGSKNDANDVNDKPVTFHFTGHSLGGALATMGYLAMKDGKLKEAIEDVTLGMIGSSASEEDKNALKKSIDDACNSSSAVTFSAPPTSDKEQINYLNNKQGINEGLVRAVIEEDLITKEPSSFLMWLINLFRPAASMRNANPNSNFADILPRHVGGIGTELSLGRYAKSGTDVGTFKNSGGMPHAPDVNRKKITTAIHNKEKGKKLPYITYQYAEHTFKNILKGGEATLMPSKYASIVVNKLDYEAELTRVLAQVLDQSTVPNMKDPITRAYLMDIGGLIKEINVDIQSVAGSSAASRGNDGLDTDLPALAKLIPVLIQLESKLKHEKDKDKFDALLRIFQKVTKALVKMEGIYTEVPNLANAISHTQGVCALYENTAHALIQFKLAQRAHPELDPSAESIAIREREEACFNFYDELHVFSKYNYSEKVLKNYELLLGRYVALDKVEDISIVKELLSQMEAYPRSVKELPKNPTLVEIHKIIAHFRRQSNGKDRMKDKAEKIIAALNELSLPELQALSYHQNLKQGIAPYSKLREALSMHRNSFSALKGKNSKQLTASMLRLENLPLHKNSALKTTSQNIHKKKRAYDEVNGIKLSYVFNGLYKMFKFEKAQNTTLLKQTSNKSKLKPKQ